MTSKQWREVSEAFDTPPGERTERQKRIAKAGLCWAYEVASGQPWILMSKALETFCGLTFCTFFKVNNCEEGDTLRASLAALFAAMSADERREVLGGEF